jgi:uncharacterized protein (DUF1697 family)
MAARKRRQKTPALGTYAALLRSVNVGGRMLPMGELVKMLDRAGCANTRTYIQSGNAVFQCPPAVAETLPTVLAKRIVSRYGFEAPVLMRTDAELRAVIRGNPFADAEGVHVAFLADHPAPARVGTLDAKRSPGDVFSVLGREIYLRVANGMGQSKLTNAYFDSKLGTISTMRNWRTVCALLEMMEALPSLP